MTSMKKIVFCVVGTRPECVKMAPVIVALRRQQWADVRVVSTGQHRELVSQTLGIFGIIPDIDLDLMQANQTLSSLTARVITAFDAVIETNRPDLVLVQGDTTTVMACALVCFYRNIKVGHVEAGLRTGDITTPFPEEMNRRMAGLVANIHFAPTERARDNLLREGIDPRHVHLTGNTVIDALLNVAARPNLPQFETIQPGNRLVFVTAHRRENFGAPLERICKSISNLVDKYSNLEFIYPVHPNPNVRNIVFKELSNIPRVHLADPLDYVNVVAAIKSADIVMTDSGGIQEEAPALGKPVLVLRSETERPEAVEAGVAILVGTDVKKIVYEVSRLVDDVSYYRSIARGVSPYGDGHAADRISQICGDAVC